LLPRHVETYVAEFFPGDNAHGVVYIWTYEDTSISVLPLLRLHARFPDLDLRFDCEEVEDWRILKGLLKLKSNPKWAQYALGSVSSLLYAFGDRELGSMGSLESKLKRTRRRAGRRAGRKAGIRVTTWDQIITGRCGIGGRKLA
tara:strand:+ start:9807 stop:10238 length:432 start_codon:yes stop_codon:yes gene_type:complete